VLLPALMLRRKPTSQSRDVEHPGWLRGWDWKMPAVVCGLIVFGYAAYSSVGMRVFGYLGGYVEEEGMQSGARYFLLQLAQEVPGMHTLPASVFLGCCVAVFAALIYWALKVAKDSPQGSGFLAPAFALALALMLLFSPHYAWYIVWLVPFLTLVPGLTVLTYLTGFFYWYTTELAEPGPKMFLANKYLYAMVLAAAIIEVVMRKWPVHRQYMISARETL
jgi:alpha-1,6-mannosyltransferase